MRPILLRKRGGKWIGHVVTGTNILFKLKHTEKMQNENEATFATVNFRSAKSWPKHAAARKESAFFGSTSKDPCSRSWWPLCIGESHQHRTGTSLLCPDDKDIIASSTIFALKAGGGPVMMFDLETKQRPFHCKEFYPVSGSFTVQSYICRDRANIFIFQNDFDLATVSCACNWSCRECIASITDMKVVSRSTSKISQKFAPSAAKL